MHTLIKHTVVDAYVKKPFAIHTYIVIRAHNHVFTNTCSFNSSFQSNYDWPSRCINSCISIMRNVVIVCMHVLKHCNKCCT